MSLELCEQASIYVNNFTANTANQAGTVYWLTNGMGEPLGLTSNNFTGNAAKVYGPNVATGISGMNVTPFWLSYNDYTPGTYPLQANIFVSDFYNQLVSSESNKVMEAVIASHADVSCSFNFAIAGLFGGLSAFVKDGIARFKHFGANCVPGGFMFVSFKISIATNSFCYSLF